MTKFLQILSRFIYTIKKAFTYRNSLRCYLDKPDLQVSKVEDITLAYLKQNGIKVIVLDYDGVLSAHGQNDIVPLARSWLKKMLVSFPGRIYFLSNGIYKERIAYCQQEYPEVKFVIGDKKKPYPDGLEFIQQDSSTQKSEICMVDDRLLMGILAACIFGCKALWVTAPIVDKKSHFWVESLFQYIRMVDKIFISLVSRRENA